MAAHDPTATASQYLQTIAEEDSLKVSLNSKKMQVKEEKVELQIIKEGKSETMVPVY